jgi:hypothetical protein
MQQKKVLFLILFLIMTFIYFLLVILVHNKIEPIASYIKTNSFLDAYNIANSTTLFGKYNYSKTSNYVLAHYYMFGIDNIVKQDFNRSEEYCLMAKEQCNITYLYKEAKSYYCQDKSIEIMAFGYENNKTEEYNKKRCTYSKKRLKEIELLEDSYYKLPIVLYWMPKFD